MQALRGASPIQCGIILYTIFHNDQLSHVLWCIFYHALHSMSQTLCLDLHVLLMFFSQGRKNDWGAHGLIRRGTHLQYLCPRHYHCFMVESTLSICFSVFLSGENLVLYCVSDECPHPESLHHVFSLVFQLHRTFICSFIKLLLLNCPVYPLFV